MNPICFYSLFFLFYFFNPYYIKYLRSMMSKSHLIKKQNIFPKILHHGHNPKVKNSKQWLFLFCVLTLINNAVVDALFYLFFNECFFHTLCHFYDMFSNIMVFDLIIKSWQISFILTRSLINWAITKIIIFKKGS